MTDSYQIYLECKDPSRNKARFYALSIEHDLFSDAVLVRRWGRIGRKGQSLRHHHSGKQEAIAQFLTLLGSKRARGYATPHSDH